MRLSNRRIAAKDDVGEMMRVGTSELGLKLSCQIFSAFPLRDLSSQFRAWQGKEKNAKSWENICIYLFICYPSFIVICGYLSF